MLRHLLLVVCLFSSSWAFALTEEDLQIVGQRIALEAGVSIIFVIEPTEELNAWVGLKPIVTITSGMLDSLQSRDELAFVLGHEVAHYASKHIKSRLKAMGWGALLGGVLVYVVGGDKDDVMLGVEIGSGITGGHKSRVHEREADALGQMLAWRSGYDPLSAIDALSLLQFKYGNGMAHVPVLGWFASHPDTGSRIANAERVAAEIDAGSPPLAKWQSKEQPAVGQAQRSTIIKASPEELKVLEGYANKWKIP